MRLAPERDERRALELPLFPRFTPSPLPGQPPVVTRTQEQRAPSWLARIGDYIQRRVEVTSWASPPAAGAHGPSVWQNQTQTLMVSTPVAAERDQRPASSSTSAGISQEVLQAEVSKQLDVAMGEMLAKLQEEKRRTDEANAEVRLLRAQLENYEMRVSDQHAVAIQAPPGLLPLVQEAHGVPPRVSANQPLPGPSASITQQDQHPWHEILPPGDQALLSLGAAVQHGERGGVAEGVDPNVTAPGVPARVSANQPLPGPGHNVFSGRTRARSQSPRGPRSFIQRLFGLGRDESGHQSQQLPRVTSATTIPPTVPPPQPPPPLPPQPTTSATGASDGDLLATFRRV